MILQYGFSQLATVVSGHYVKILCGLKHICVLKSDHNTSKTQSTNIRETLTLPSNTKLSLPHLQVLSWQNIFLLSHKDSSTHPPCKVCLLWMETRVSSNHLSVPKANVFAKEKAHVTHTYTLLLLGLRTTVLSGEVLYETY